MADNKISIRTLLLRDIGGLFIVALGASLAVTLYFATQGAFLLAAENAEEAIDNIRSRLETHFEPANRTAELIGTQVMRAGYPLSPATADKVQTVLTLSPQIRGMAFAWADGHRVIIGPEGIVADDRFSAGSNIGRWVEESARIGELYVGDPVYSPDAGSTVIAAQKPVFADDGTYLGVAASAFTIVELSRFVREMDVIGGAVFVLDEKQRILAHPALADPTFQSGVSVANPLLTPLEVGDEVLNEFLDPGKRETFIIEGTDGIEFWQVDVDGVDFIALAHEIPVGPSRTFTVGVYLDADAATYSDTMEYIGFGAAVGVVVLILALLRLRVIAERIRQPVSELASASHSVANLDLDKAVVPAKHSVEEFGQAANAFNSMVTGLSQFETYVPRTLVRQILQADGAQKVASAEREITVLFSDIVGFTTISQNLSADRVAALLNSHFTLLNDAIEAEGGNVDKYIGDSVMAFWGAPMPRKDHADQALRAVRRIVRDIAEDNKRREAQGHMPIHVRIGVATGAAIVGNIGAPGRINYTTVGDTVNVANRLEQLGKTLAPDREVAVLVSESTVNAASTKDDLSDAGLHELRGRTGAVRVYRLDADAPALSTGP